MKIGMRHRRVIVATMVAATTALAGCGEDVEAAASWPQPDNYTYVLESACGERGLIGRFHITVKGGAVVATKGLDEPAQRILETNTSIAPTLRQLLDELNAARQSGADIADLTTDPTDGHPTKITIDPSRTAIDDEACYTITNYTV